MRAQEIPPDAHGNEQNNNNKKSKYVQQLLESFTMLLPPLHIIYNGT